MTDTGNNCVQVLNSDLTFSSTFGKDGDGKGQFWYPTGIACDSAGEVYVADTNNHRIQVFTAEGKFVGIFGVCGQELSSPYGIAIDSSNMVYVSESKNSCITVFTTEGQYRRAFGRRGMCPRGLAVE